MKLEIAKGRWCSEAKRDLIQAKLLLKFGTTKNVKQTPRPWKTSPNENEIIRGIFVNRSEAPRTYKDIKKEFETNYDIAVSLKTVRRPLMNRNFVDSKMMEKCMWATSKQAVRSKVHNQNRFTWWGAFYLARCRPHSKNWQHNRLISVQENIWEWYDYFRLGQFAFKADFYAWNRPKHTSRLVKSSLENK